MKVYFDTIGCRLNQSEIEKMASQARANGHEVVARAAQADVVIINTCAVTLAASSDSRMKIRQAARAGTRASSPPAATRQLPRMKLDNCRK
jgi:threonylcarbamoyladenosine tRNA methylthiotransferase MtaB